MTKRKDHARLVTMYLPHIVCPNPNERDCASALSASHAPIKDAIKIHSGSRVNEYKKCEADVFAVHE